MRTWTKSACVVLAWSILPIILAVASMKGPASLAQANTRTASSTEITLTSTMSVAAAPVPAARHTVRYVVQPGDTLSGIAARFALRGGWPALYAANKRAIGSNPNVIHAGTRLVLPGHLTPIRYKVVPGDTLSGIAARFAVRGGWPALYAANKRVIGPHPNVIHSGTVLRIPSLAASAPSSRRSSHRRHRPAPRPSRTASPRNHPSPTARGALAATGAPMWVKTMLLALGLLILVALLAASVMVVNRRRQRQTTAQALRPRSMAGSGLGQGFRWPIAVDTARTRIVFADHDRLVVTRDENDDTICVLRPPGEDPETILRVARLVLPEEPYRHLAAELGIAPNRTEE